MLVGALHVALVAPWYHVGSFDDDAGYILAARALLAGHAPFSQYPPGYSALLVPLVWLWPHSFVPLRVFSGVCFAAIFPLTWLFLSRRSVGFWEKTAVLLLVALSPPLGTFGSMVMAETPFLVVLLLLLLAIDRWTPRRAAATILLAAALVWLKEAGIGLVLGLVAWYVLSGRWRRGAVVGGGVGLLLLPVVAVRLASGTPLAGARYSFELGGYYHGGLLDRLTGVVPSGLWQLLTEAVPRLLVPYGSPFPFLGGALDALAVQVTVFTALGAAVWFTRHRDPAIPMVAAYLAECTLWPYVNERRTILITPLLAAWYVLGVVSAWRFFRRRARRAAEGGRPVAAAGLAALGRPVVAAGLAAAVVAVPLAVQMPRDYLFALGQASSRPGGSRYAEILSRVGEPAQVVETDYRSAVQLFTGHATQWTAFVDTTGSCDPSTVERDLAADRAAFLLVGDLNKPDLLDSTCLLQQAESQPWAVELLHTSRDDATVFELVGAGTGNPSLSADLAVQSAPGGTWLLPAGSEISQVSLGSASAPVRIDLLEPGGWVPVAGSKTAVGGGPGSTPFLLAAFSHPLRASAVRVTFSGSGTGSFRDLAVLGPLSA
jgi:hypothetical protein